LPNGGRGGHRKFPGNENYKMDGASSCLVTTKAAQGIGDGREAHTPRYALERT